MQIFAAVADRPPDLGSGLPNKIGNLTRIGRVKANSVKEFSFSINNEALHRVVLFPSDLLSITAELCQ